MMMATNQQPKGGNRSEVRQGVEAAGELQEVCLQKDTERAMKIGRGLGEVLKSKLVGFLQEHQDCFAWLPDDLSGIPTRFAQHSLNIKEKAKPVK